VFRTSDYNVYVSVPQDKWDKAKRLINSLWAVIEEAGAHVDGCDLSNVQLVYKELEVARGFLVHLSMTFEMLTHHLKGLSFSSSFLFTLVFRCWVENE
jgi:hypothetical protein